MTRRPIPYLALLAATFFGGCATTNLSPTSGAPEFIIGQFEDDYGIRYAIDKRDWVQLPHATYHVVEWNPSAQFLIARNDSDNPTEPNLFTRIDWIELAASSEFPWAYCYSVYAAQSASDAKQQATIDRNTPLTGCNGYPFSRMKRLN